LGVIKNWIKNLWNWDYFPIAVFSLGICIFELFLQPSGDDLIYGTVFYQEPLVAFISQAYFDWSSRILIMPVAAFFAGNSFLFFEIVNVLVYSLMAVMVSKLFITENKRHYHWVLMLMLFCVPFITMMTTAGWVVTNIHYMWPLTAALVAVYPIKKYLGYESIRWFEYPIYLFCTFFSMNMELMAGTLVLIYVAYVIYFYLVKRPFQYGQIIALILIVNIIYILFCPGNAVRESSEIVTNFPEYASFGIIQKLAVSATAHVFSIDQNFLMLTVTAMAGVFVWNLYSKGIYRLLGVLPLLFALGINLWIIVLSPKFDGIFCDCTGKRIENWISLAKITHGTLSQYHYLILLFIGLYVLSLCVMIILLFKNSSKFGVSLILVGASILTQAVMGFSPTVYESGTRTFLFHYVAMAILGVIMYVEFNSRLSKRQQQWLFYGLVLAGFCGYLESLQKLI
jgi:hypothetical protein